jgi:hypothetical protein
MATLSDVEEYVQKFTINAKKIDESAWQSETPDGSVDNLIILYYPPQIIFRIKVASIPKDNQLKFFKRLLELNSTILHGAYAVDGNSVVLIDTLETEHLDPNEFQASIDSLAYSVAEHSRMLSKFLPKKKSASTKKKPVANKKPVAKEKPVVAKVKKAKPSTKPKKKK